MPWWEDRHRNRCFLQCLYTFSVNSTSLTIIVNDSVIKWCCRLTTAACRLSSLAKSNRSGFFFNIVWETPLVQSGHNQPSHTFLPPVRHFRSTSKGSWGPVLTGNPYRGTSWWYSVVISIRCKIFDLLVVVKPRIHFIWIMMNEWMKYIILAILNDQSELTLSWRAVNKILGG